MNCGAGHIVGHIEKNPQQYGSDDEDDVSMNDPCSRPDLAFLFLAGSNDDDDDDDDDDALPPLFRPTPPALSQIFLMGVGSTWRYSVSFPGLTNHMR